MGGIRLLSFQSQIFSALIRGSQGSLCLPTSTFAMQTCLPHLLILWGLGFLPAAVPVWFLPATASLLLCWSEVCRAGEGGAGEEVWAQASILPQLLQPREPAEWDSLGQSRSVEPWQQGWPAGASTRPEDASDPGHLSCGAHRAAKAGRRKPHSDVWTLLAVVWEGIAPLPAG